MNVPTYTERDVLHDNYDVPSSLNLFLKNNRKGQCKVKFNINDYFY